MPRSSTRHRGHSGRKRYADRANDDGTTVQNTAPSTSSSALLTIPEDLAMDTTAWNFGPEASSAQSGSSRSTGRMDAILTKRSSDQERRIARQVITALERTLTELHDKWKSANSSIVDKENSGETVPQSEYSDRDHTGALCDVNEDILLCARFWLDKFESGRLDVAVDGTASDLAGPFWADTVEDCRIARPQAFSDQGWETYTRIVQPF